MLCTVCKKYVVLISPYSFRNTFFLVAVRARMADVLIYSKIMELVLGAGPHLDHECIARHCLQVQGKSVMERKPIPQHK